MSIYSYLCEQIYNLITVLQHKILWYIKGRAKKGEGEFEFCHFFLFIVKIYLIKLEKF